MSRSKHHSPAAIKIDGKLAFQVTLELVAAPREIPHYRQVWRGGQVVQPGSELLGTSRSIAPPGCLVVIADLLQRWFGKDDDHGTEMYINP